MNTKINYAYAFAAPHRITLSRPKSSSKTLCDIDENNILMSWSYDCLKDYEVGICRTPRIDWRVRLKAFVNGKPIRFSSWTRLEDYLPGFSVQTVCDDAEILIDAISSEDGDIIRVKINNKTDKPVTASILMELTTPHWVVNNPAFLDGRNANTLLCMDNQRPKRVLAAGFGASCYPLAMEKRDRTNAEVPMELTSSARAEFPRSSVTMENSLNPGEEKVNYIFRPYNMDLKALPKDLSSDDLQAKFDFGVSEWKSLLKKATKYTIPDKGVQKAVYACLSDLFVMSEFDRDDNFIISPGSDCYRSPNYGDGLIAADAMGEFGFTDEQREAQAVFITAQDDDGDWNDPDGWCHDMIFGVYHKACSIMRYYRLTGDIDYLKKVYPYMKKALYYDEKVRATTRNAPDKAVRGLKPRCFGDCGLDNDGDPLGVFYPANLCAVAGDGIICDIAEILGDPDFSEMKGYYETARNDLRDAIHEGYIIEDGYKIIPNTPRKHGGSSYCRTVSTFPCKVLDKDDPIALGSLAYVEANISEGGQPIGTGWMKDGCWINVSLNNVAVADIGYGKTDTALGYFLSAINYASPLTSWPEERGIEAGSTKLSGDRQHVWTPAEICHYMYNSITRNDDDVLHLFESIDRDWLDVGEEIMAENVVTSQGKMNLSARRISDNTLSVSIKSFEPERLGKMRLHLRVPEKNYSIRSVDVSGANFTSHPDFIDFSMTSDVCQLELNIG